MSPQLAAALKNTITIELRDAPVRSVFELISKRAGRIDSFLVDGRAFSAAELDRCNAAAKASAAASLAAK